MRQATSLPITVKTLLILILTLPLVAVGPPRALGMPPQPDHVNRLEAGTMVTPSFLANMEVLQARGVNQAIAPPRIPGAAASARMAGPSGSINALALLVDFSDNESQVGATYFDTLIFGTGTGTVRDYYEEVSYGTLTLVTVNLPSAVGWLRAPQTYAYYVNHDNGFGAYPQNAQKLVEDVVDAADAVVDFSQYDNDGDGYVDALFVVHAGPGAEFTGSLNDIWSHQWSITPRLKDGVRIYTYSMEPEYWQTPGDMTIGVYAHELGHVFGLPDLYDYDYSSEGAGDWSLMAGGSWNGPYPGGSLPAHLDAWSRIQLEFASPTILTADAPGLSINAVETIPEIYYAWDCGNPNNEFFLLENRQKVGYDASLPGAGLLIWHVDENKSNNNRECRNHANCSCSNHYLVALEQADGALHLEYGSNRGNTGDPFPGSTNNRTFNLASTPNSGSYADCKSTVAVTNISDSAATMTADVTVCGLPPGLSWIHLSQPSNGSVAYLAPTFSWTSDGVPTCVYAVDFALPPAVPFWSTYENLQILISQKSWELPQSLWDQVPSGATVYWRVRGADPADPPIDIITSDEVWTFQKY